PYLVMQEIWRASVPRAPRALAADWREGKASVAVSLWWAFCLLALLPWPLETHLVENARDPNLAAATRWTDTVIVLWSNTASLLAAVFGALSVLTIRRRQVLRFEQLRQEAARLDTTFGGDITSL